MRLAVLVWGVCFSVGFGSACSPLSWRCILRRLAWVSLVVEAMSSRRVRAEFATGGLAFPRGVRESLGVGTKTLNLLRFESLVLGRPE